MFFLPGYDPALIVFGNVVFSVIDVLWQSTHVFLAAYEPNPSDSDEQPSLVIVNAPVSKMYSLLHKISV